MPDHKEQLNSMLMSIIKGDTTSASVTMHDYFVAKTREVAGLATPEVDVDTADQGSEPSTDDAAE